MTVVIYVYRSENTGRVINAWLERYDPEAYDGRGWADFTPRLIEAQRFADREAALALITAVPEKRPVRPDGKPNRPLRSFTVEIETLEQAAQRHP